MALDSAGPLYLHHSCAHAAIAHHFSSDRHLARTSRKVRRFEDQQGKPIAVFCLLYAPVCHSLLVFFPFSWPFGMAVPTHNAATLRHCKLSQDFRSSHCMPERLSIALFDCKNKKKLPSVMAATSETSPSAFQGIAECPVYHPTVRTRLCTPSPHALTAQKGRRV